MRKDVIVIGGSAAGLVAATTTKAHYPEKSVLIIRLEDKVLVPCGIPYIFGTLESSDQNVMPDQGVLNSGVEILVNKVENVYPEEHKIELINGDIYEYSKLIFATGSTPYVPAFISGTDLGNVYTVPKNKKYLDAMYENLRGMNKIAVIGAGFIGVETADEMKKMGLEVVLIEAKETILGEAFDPETCIIAEDVLSKRGVEIRTNSFVKCLCGEQDITHIELRSGETIEVDAAILSIGYRPNIELAKKSGISVNKQGAIKVDSYMRTHQKDIYACGDCAQKRDFATGRIKNIMLASTACAEARVAGMNLFELSTIRTFNGTIGIYSTNIGDTSFGVAGITESRAIEEGFNMVSASFTGMDRHPGKLDNAHFQTVKLVATKNRGLIMGGEVIGGSSVGELTNVLGFIIQNKMTVSDLLCSQIGTQPMLTASPAKYPLIKAAEMIAKKMNYS